MMHLVPEHHRRFHPGFQPDRNIFGKLWKLPERSRHGDENHRQQQARPEKLAQDGRSPHPGRKRIDGAPAHDRPGHDPGGETREAHAHDQDLLAADHALESTIQVVVNNRNRAADQEPGHAEHGREAAQAIGDAKTRRHDRWFSSRGSSQVKGNPARGGHHGRQGEAAGDRRLVDSLGQALRRFHGVLSWRWTPFRSLSRPGAAPA